MKKSWTGNCPNCGHNEFEVTMNTHDQVEYIANIDVDGSVDTFDFLKDYCGDTTTDYTHDFECCECGKTFNWENYFPEQVKIENEEQRMRNMAPELFETLVNVIEALQELHQDEINNNHYGDNSCDYCSILDRTREIINKIKN